MVSRGKFRIKCWPQQVCLGITRQGSIPFASLLCPIPFSNHSIPGEVSLTPHRASRLGVFAFAVPSSRNASLLLPAQQAPSLSSKICYNITNFLSSTYSFSLCSCDTGYIHSFVHQFLHSTSSNINLMPHMCQTLGQKLETQKQMRHSSPFDGSHSRQGEKCINSQYSIMRTIPFTKGWDENKGTPGISWVSMLTGVGGCYYFCSHFLPP